MLTEENKANALKLAEHLRTTDIVQCRGTSKVSAGTACALASFFIPRERIMDDSKVDYMEVSWQANEALGDISPYVLTWNDTERLTFPQIAEKIEEYVRTN